MIAGCIPIVDHAPLINIQGLIEGVHFLYVSSFNISELKRISNINMDNFIAPSPGSVINLD